MLQYCTSDLHNILSHTAATAANAANRRPTLSGQSFIGKVLDQARLPTPLCHCILQTLPPSLPNTEHILQVGPSRLLLEGESSTEARDRLHTMLAAFPAAPFSYQRLAELLLEPRKQYSQLHKLVRLR